MYATGCETEEGETHGRLTRVLFSCMAIITDWYGIASTHPNLSQYRIRSNIATQYAGS